MANNDSDSLHPPHGSILAPSWGELRPAFRELFYAGWVLSAIGFAGVLGFVATVQPYSFDRLTDLYPFVADGWGIWYWLAQLGLSYTAYIFILNTITAALVFIVAVPMRRERLPVDLCLLTIAYFVLWFLFGQTRFGMALAIIAPVAVAGTWPVFWICGLLAALIHKGAAGGVLLLFFWRVLRDRRKGLIIAASISISAYVLVHTVFGRLLEIAGYANYGGWADLPSANTPVKYFYLVAVLLLWMVRQKKQAISLLILIVLFFPTAFFNVFAGRGFQLCSAVLLAALLRTHVPFRIRFFVMLPYAIELVLLVFTSGLYF
jgi:hypothetical protein